MTTSYYRSIFKKSPYGYICHKIGTAPLKKINIQLVEDTNDSFLKIFGIEAGNEPLKQVGDFLMRSDVNSPFSWENYLCNCRNSQEQFSSDFFYPPNNKWIQLNSYVAEGYLITCAIDISSTKKEEARKHMVMNHQMKLLSMIAEQSPVSVVITNVEGNIEYVNTKFCQLTGYTALEMVGCSPRMLKSGQTSEESYRELWKALSNGCGWRGEFINRKKNGDIYYESAIITPTMDEAGCIVHYVAIKEDITERILAQQAMVANAKRLLALLDVAQSFGSTINMDKLLNIVISNSIELLEMDSGMIYFMLGNKMDRVAIYPSNDIEVPFLVKKFDIGEFPHIVECIKQKDILIVNDLESVKLTSEEKRVSQFNNSLSALAIPLVLEDTVLAVLVLRSSKKNRLFNQADLEACKVLASQASMALKNASLYKEVERHVKRYANYNRKLSILNDQLRIEKNKAEQGDLLKTAFLRNMSHEVRTPLNAILGFSELLKMDNSSEYKREFFLDHIINSGNHLLSIVEDIMHVSRIQAGDVKLKKERLDPAPIIENIFNKYVSHCSPEIVLNMENPTIGQDKVLVTEGARLSQVLDSLVDNAIKFTNSGTVRFGYSISENSKMHVFVEDTGVGMCSENLTSIFKPFYQVDMGEDREFGGNGLGLTIAYRIIESMGSTLSVKTELGRGSYFSFELELACQSVSM